MVAMVEYLSMSQVDLKSVYYVLRKEELAVCPASRLGEERGLVNMGIEEGGTAQSIAWKQPGLNGHGWYLGR